MTARSTTPTRASSLGMAAVIAPADAVWNWGYIGASVVIGMTMSAIAMTVLLRRAGTQGLVLGAVLFTLAICAINSWNRLNIAARTVPGSYQPKQFAAMTE